MGNIIIENDDLFKVSEMTDGLYRILLPGNVYAYLAVGSERALLIDTGFGYGRLRPLIEKLTDKPYDVLITHGHVDHAGGAAEFDTVYMDLRDLPIAKEHTSKQMRFDWLQEDRSMGENTAVDPDLLVDPLPPDAYLPLEEGQEFDLGDLTLKVLTLTGHTPGSVTVLFKEPGLLLTGDAVNSMTLLSLGGCLTVHEYRDSLVLFKDKLAAAVPDVSALKILYSHPHNFGGPEILDEMIDVCNEVIAGTADNISMPGRPGLLAKAMDFEHGMKRPDGKSANLAYIPDRI
ncbi:MAG: MBL fold metallo-hydrolase [Lachnospiraceae bacterium]|nr:MBL fold metallo-hydrolase [Lachnospiraceae bacterium]